MSGTDPRVAARRLLSRHAAAWIPDREGGSVRIKDAVDAIVEALSSTGTWATGADEAAAREAALKLLRGQNVGASDGGTSFVIVPTVDDLAAAMLSFARHCHPASAAGGGDPLRAAAHHALTFITNRFSDLSPEKRSTVEHLRRALATVPRAQAGGEGVAVCEHSFQSPWQCHECDAANPPPPGYDPLVTSPPPTPEPDALEKAIDRDSIAAAIEEMPRSEWVEYVAYAAGKRTLEASIAGTYRRADAVIAAICASAPDQEGGR